MKNKQKQLKQYVMLAIGCLLSYGTYSQSPSLYSLEESIQIALDQNQQVSNSQLDIQSAEYSIKEVKSALMPTIDIHSQYQYYMKLPAQYAPASAFGGPEDQYTKLSLNMPQTTMAHVQLTQNLFNKQVFIGMQAADAAREVSLHQATLTQENIIYHVTATYYSIQVLNDNLLRLEENIVNVEKAVEISESLKVNELVSDNVHNRLLISLENLRNQYENQKLSQQKNITFLKYLMNLDMQDSLQVTPFAYNEALSQPSLTEISQRPDIQLQQAQIKLSEFDKQSIVAKYYPVLTGSLSYGYTSFYDGFSPTKQINGDWINSSYFGLSLKIPVFDGFQKHHQIRQKELAIQKNNNTLTMMKSNARKEVEDAASNYVANRNLVVSNKKSLDLAEALFNTVQSEYANGLTTLTEFINAQNELSDARTNYSAALLNMKLAELALKKANGTLVTQL